MSHLPTQPWERQSNARTGVRLLHHRRRKIPIWRPSRRRHLFAGASLSVNMAPGETLRKQTTLPFGRFLFSRLLRIDSGKAEISHHIRKNYSDVNTQMVSFSAHGFVSLGGVAFGNVFMILLFSPLRHVRSVLPTLRLWCNV